MKSGEVSSAISMLFLKGSTVRLFAEHMNDKELKNWIEN